MAKNIRQLFDELTEKHAALASATPVNTTEKAAEKRLRIKYLEQNHEEWFKFYFPAYAKAEPAQFHKDAANRVIDHPEFIEERNWSRELAKSTRTMMEVLFLTLTGRKKNVIMVSNSKENADRLLLPYQVNLERNNRIINDYGEQQNLGQWTAGEFITKKNVAFRALGAGQSPRGTRNEAARPDVILIDDIDTDEDCRNPDIIDKRWEWIQEALIPTRSISNPLLIIFCGNVIAEDCCALRMQEYADHVDVINIRDANGKSSWPEKNNEADIDRVLSTISYAAQQKEYFNNPMSSGKTFPEITWGKCPDIKELKFIVAYADPATSNTDKPGQKSGLNNSRKAIAIIGKLNDKYYIYKVFLDVMGQAHFIEYFYACREYISRKTIAYYLIENNSLQDPFYQQVILPNMWNYARQNKVEPLNITPDPRDKGDKWTRIEANLEPLNRLGRLIFNEDEKENPHMKRLVAQFKSAKANSKELDGPDAVEGGVFIINTKIKPLQDIITAKRKNNPKRF